MNDINLLEQPPRFDCILELTIWPLSSVSLVTDLPGKYYRSAGKPSQDMLYGLLENALGWHIIPKHRKDILSALIRRHRIGTAPTASGVGFQSILQFHLKFIEIVEPENRYVQRHNDYWSQHLRTSGLEFAGGSREYDSRMIPLMNARLNKDVTFTDSGGRRDDDIIAGFRKGDKINVAALKTNFPRYYVSPTPREYLTSDLPFRAKVATSAAISAMIKDGLNDPEAPLYIGSNDGWVDVSVKDVELESTQ